MMICDIISHSAKQNKNTHNDYSCHNSLYNSLLLTYFDLVLFRTNKEFEKSNV
jgi:hypothetical protein